MIEKEYFYPNGHLTDYALRQTINGEENLLRRLEIAEHLSFCDMCVDRYTALVEEGEILAPPQVLSTTVVSKIKGRMAKDIFTRATTMAVAASFAMALWVGGAFEIYPDTIKGAKTIVVKSKDESFRKEVAEKIDEKIEEFLEVLINGEKK